MSRQSKGTQAAGVSTLILGLKKHFPTGSMPLQIGGASYTVDSLSAILQGVVDQQAAVEAARAAFSAKVQTVRATASSNNAVIHAFKTYVRGAFGTSTDALADFGLSPPKARAPTTAEQKAVAVAKRAATRKARGTLGKVQKKDIKGAVTAALVVTLQRPRSCDPLRGRIVTHVAG